MRRLAAAVALAIAAVPLGAAPASAECTEVDLGVSRAGYCQDESCRLIWLDLLTQVQDDGLAVWLCGSGRDTYICTLDGRDYSCTYPV